MNSLLFPQLSLNNIIDPKEAPVQELSARFFELELALQDFNFWATFSSLCKPDEFGDDLAFSTLLKNTFCYIVPSQIVDAQELVPLLVFSLLAIFLALVILGASFFFAIQKPDTEKLSIYECGFDPYEDSRNKFDIRFYIVAILFIIFDLETIFCFPWIMSLGLSDSLAFWAMMDFLLELVVGFVYVWCAGALVWE